MQQISPEPTAELTPRVLILGLGLAMVMAAANVYLGLKVGMTVAASIPAAVVAMLVLKGILRTGTLLEANQVQTSASAGEALAAGVIFTLPALVIIGAWKQFDMVATTLIALVGGVMGVLLMIPMRRVFVLGSPELKFPEAVACARVLEAGQSLEHNKSGALAVLYGTLMGGGFKLMASFFGLFRGTLEGAFVAQNRIWYYGADLSPALLAIGLIVRLEIAFLTFLGGALAWMIGIPLLGRGEEFLANPVEGAWTLWADQIRYVGVGAMVVGGVASIYDVRRGLVEALRELRKAGAPGEETVDPNQRDLPSRWIVSLSLLCLFLMAAYYYTLLNGVVLTLATTLTMAVMSFFFTAVASYVVGLVGASNSPISGMTITAVLFTGGLLYILGFSGMDGMVATLGVAAIVCCVASTAGDTTNDLRTGVMLGASPWKQQLNQLLGVGVSALVMAPVLQLLHEQTPGGIGGRELTAPQAMLFASLARGLFGDGQLPWNMVGAGAVVGVLVLGLDKVLERRGASFRVPLMPLAVGMYLSFGLGTPMLVGGLIAHVLAGKGDEDEKETRLSQGVLLSSGMIAGESLMGVGLALLASWGLDRMELGLAEGTITGLSWGGALLLTVLFWRLSLKRVS